MDNGQVETLCLPVAWHKHKNNSKSSTRTNLVNYYADARTQPRSVVCDLTALHQRHPTSNQRQCKFVCPIYLSIYLSIYLNSRD